MLRGWCQGRRGRTEFDEDEDVKEDGVRAGEEELNLMRMRMLRG